MKEQSFFKDWQFFNLLFLKSMLRGFDTKLFDVLKDENWMQ